MKNAHTYYFYYNYLLYIIKEQHIFKYILLLEILKIKNANQVNY